MIVSICVSQMQINSFTYLTYCCSNSKNVSF